MSERTFDDFDGYAADYRAIHTENVKWSGADSLYFAEMKVQVLQPFEQNKSLCVLDIGCGDGATEKYMQQYFSQWQLKGIDVSAKSIEEAEKKDLSNASFSIYNGTNVPFEEGSFDIVFIAGVLHHIDSALHPALVKEAFRVLKKGGRLYLFEHNPLNPVTKYLVKTCVFDKAAKLLGSNYVAVLLKRSGFAVNKKLFLIFFPRKGLLSRFIFLEKWLQWLPLGGQYFIKATK